MRGMFQPEKISATDPHRFTSRTTAEAELRVNWITEVPAVHMKNGHLTTDADLTVY